uniref:Carbamoyl phosphate synthase arginine-specific small chain n=1 Tax=Chloropicon laureae TaxID=464258 RepID=A0A7S3E1U0_9CHLO
MAAKTVKSLRGGARRGAAAPSSSPSQAVRRTAVNMSSGRAATATARHPALGLAPGKVRGSPAASKAASRGVRCSASKPWKENDARLVLENGDVYPGYAFGHTGDKTYVAEVVFNTSLTGYQEILTDPSYHGQMVCFTQPHIGNVGINEGDMECGHGCHLSGVVVKHLSENVSNYRSVETLEQYLERQGVVGIAGVDTRQLTRVLREKGSLVGVVCTDASISDEALVQQATEWSILGKDLLKEVTCKEPYEWKEETEGEWEFKDTLHIGGKAGHTDDGKDLKVVAYDFGIKSNILKRLSSRGCSVTVVPADYPWEKVLEMSPDGVFFSNGPGDPSAAPYAVENAKNIIGKLPAFGICMGHQILGQAFGGTTYKLKFGHHGGNHPIKNTLTGLIEISAQNHNFAVDPDTLPSDVTVTHVNLNDGTVAGMVSQEKNVLTIQYHPEASPGPHDADVAFDQFVSMMRNRKGTLEPKVVLSKSS